MQGLLEHLYFGYEHNMIPLMNQPSLLLLDLMFNTVCPTQ